MDSDEGWNTFLHDHPIFAPAKDSGASASGAGKDERQSLELSLKTLPDFTNQDTQDIRPAHSGRRQVMLIKDSDMIVAVGSEIRMASLGDAKLNKSQSKTYKALHTPNVNFDIHQMALNPNGKFLAVAGAQQIAVIVLPRTGFTKHAPATLECKSIQIGRYYHAASGSAPIAKVDWHPWGDSGTTLLVMTVDGKLREYDIAVDIEEPQQVLSFVPEKTRKSYLAEDDAERQVSSFTLGKGKADWGPLSVYAVMRSGDIYAICPYMPKNAAIPSSYAHALECFVAAKQEFLSTAEASGPSSSTSSNTNNLASVYDYQHKYVTALLKQLPPGTEFPSKSRTVLMHPPTTMRTQPVRQGPFLLQPSPLMLDGSEGGDATDIVYLSFGTDGSNGTEDETERLGVVLVAYQDGKVDVFLDVEKVEARWERKHGSNEELPMLAVYETIDLGLVAQLTKPSLLDLLQGNHPVFLQDPIHDETVYVYHAFGVHALQLGRLLHTLASALRDDVSNDGDSLLGALDQAGGTLVQPILTTFSSAKSSSNPVVGVAIPNDVYLTYSIFILTSIMRITALPLTLDDPAVVPLTPDLSSSTSLPTDGPPAYVSLLTEPFVMPKLTDRMDVLRQVARNSKFPVTPEGMRHLGKTSDLYMGQIREVLLAGRAVELRCELQKAEFDRQQAKARELLERIDRLKGQRQEETRRKLERVRDAQKALMTRVDKTLIAMTNSASPGLSETERRWFEELKRLREDIVGKGRYDEQSLVSRTNTLRRDLDRYLPSLKELQLKEEKLRKKMLADGLTGLGVSQAFELGERASTERSRISEIEKEVLKLATKLDVTLGKPPPLQGQSVPSDER